MYLRCGKLQKIFMKYMQIAPQMGHPWKRMDCMYILDNKRTLTLTTVVRDMDSTSKGFRVQVRIQYECQWNTFHGRPDYTWYCTLYAIYMCCYANTEYFNGRGKGVQIQCDIAHRTVWLYIRHKMIFFPFLPARTRVQQQITKNYTELTAMMLASIFIYGSFQWIHS